VPVFGITRDAGSPRELHAYRIDNGSTLVGVGDATGYSLPNNTPVVMEVYVNMHDTTGAVSIWVDGTQILNVSGVDTMPAGGAANAHCWMVGNFHASATVDANGYWGEIICADAQIHTPWGQRKKFAVLKPTGSGASSSWTGTYANVDEVPPDDSDFLYTNGAGNYHVFAMENLPAEAQSVNAVQVWVRGVSKGGPTPKKFFPVVNCTGNLYGGYTTTVPAVNPWHTKYIWPLNPKTSAAWTPAEVNAFETGVGSAA
jgi:hypothetical protein